MLLCFKIRSRYESLNCKTEKCCNQMQELLFQFNLFSLDFVSSLLETDCPIAEHLILNLLGLRINFAPIVMFYVSKFSQY